MKHLIVLAAFLALSGCSAIQGGLGGLNKICDDTTGTLCANVAKGCETAVGFACDAASLGQKP